jgi:preprotein translocase subunit SecF
MINIISKRYWFFLISAIVIVPGLISLIAFGLKPSTDFQPGSTVTISFQPQVDESALRQAMTAAGYADATIQLASTGTSAGNYFVSLPQITSAQETTLMTDLQTSLNSTPTPSDFTTTSAAVAAQTVRYAIIAVIVAAICIMVYIAWAFRKMPRPFRWGICAIIALLHDLLVVIGIFSILGWLLGIKIDALFITGVLTVAGYSVHDTIVVFDRIRENMLKGSNKDFEKTVDFSINETFVRSLNTSLTVLFVLFALFLLGGSTIHYFVLVLLIGVITGTYSSICNASALLVVWENNEWRRFISWIPGVSKNKKEEAKTA